MRGGVISVTERAAYIGRVRALARACCEAWLRAPRPCGGGGVGAMAELLLELLSEEIPARMQARAAADLGELVGAALDQAELAHRQSRDLQHAAAPDLVVRASSRNQPDVEIERRGPRVGAPGQALEGFLGSLGVEDYRLEEQDDSKGRVHVARFIRRGQPAADVLGRCWSRSWPLSLAQVDALGRLIGALGAAAARHRLPARWRGRAGRRSGR